MADRTSAEIFSNIFEHLAAQEKPDMKFVKWLWEKSNHYDFHPCQMGCDDELIKLGLAEEIKDGAGNIIEMKYDGCEW